LAFFASRNRCDSGLAASLLIIGTFGDGLRKAAPDKGKLSSKIYFLQLFYSTVFKEKNTNKLNYGLFINQPNLPKISNSKDRL